MKKFKKTFDLRKGKLNVTYTVDEITVLFRVTKGTVYRWIREGLTPLDQNLPYLIYGKKLREFLKERRRKRKWVCEIDQLPCFKCQRPRRALENKAWIQFSRNSRVNLAAICDVCQSRMYKCVSAKNLTETMNCFHMEKLHNLHLLDCTSPTCNDDSTDTNNAPKNITQKALTRGVYINSITSYSSAVETIQRRMAL